MLPPLDTARHAPVASTPMKTKTVRFLCPGGRTVRIITIDALNNPRSTTRPATPLDRERARQINAKLPRAI